MLKAQPDRLRVESSTDAFVCASWEVWVPAAHRACFWAVAIVQHNGSAPASDYCFTAPERLLAPSMSANATVLTMPRSAVTMLLECAVVRFRGAEPECCRAWKAVAAP